MLAGDDTVALVEVLLVGVLLLVVVLAVLGERRVPRVLLRKLLKWLTFVKLLMFCRPALPELSSERTAAWNQPLPSRHISGPPVSPWTDGPDGPRQVRLSDTKISLNSRPSPDLTKH